MIRQTDIAEILNRDQSDISRFLSGKKRVSWPLAEQLAALCTWKDIIAWKNATPNELVSAFQAIGERKQ